MNIIWRIQVITELSCIAKDMNMYVVANVIELEDCSFNCRPDGVNLFSTTVVFDREGVVVATLD